MSISLPDTGAAGITYNISGATDDLITVDPNNFCNGSITTASTLSWSSTYDNYHINPSDPRVNITSEGVNMKDDCDLKIGDRSLKDFMDRVEDQLAILRPAPELEERWDRLKEIRRQYEECKQDILEKEKIMKILKEQ